MTVSSSSNNSSSSNALPVPPPPPLPPALAAVVLGAPPPPPPGVSRTITPLSSVARMRLFAAIVCCECLYLEFPGCDVHGVLYTERVATGDSKRLHAKCPECSAATNNVRPFRDGCRRCKGATAVSMWAATRDEVAQAHDAFPPHTEELAHTALVCDACQSVVFPRARAVLTRRAGDEPLTTAGGKPLKVSNFQLSMPHVDGCSRKGMPLTAVAIQLPRSELQFVRERIDKCPLAPWIRGGPQYRKRRVEVVAQQNHLHQIYLRLLSSIVQSFDSDAPTAAEPLTKVLAMFAQMEPLALFPDWSPPRELSTAVATPTRVLASSELDKDHGAHRILESGEAFWRSAPPAAQRPRDEWLVVQFSAGVMLSALTLHWHPDFTPSRYSIAVSADGSSHETVAIVVDGAAESRVTLAKHQARATSTIKISLLAAKHSSMTYALKSVTCHEAMFQHLYTASDDVLRNLQGWLLKASVSACKQVRELAIQALQQLALASGSLCGILQLATGLLLNTSAASHESGSCQLDAAAWDEVDLLSASAQESAGAFLRQLSLSIQKFIVDNDRPGAGENSLLEKHVIEEMAAGLENELELGGAGDDPRDPNAVHPVAAHSAVSSVQPAPVGSDGQLQKPALGDGGVSPFLTLAVAQPAFATCIKRRSQLGVVLLGMVSELSAWQMKRMQRAEEFAGKREGELMRLEEPFSIEVRPEFFDVSHRLLSCVLAPWLSGDKRQRAHERTSEWDDEAKESERSGGGGHSTARGGNAAPAVDLYALLQRSFADLRAGVNDESSMSATAGSELSRITPHEAEQLFSPDGLCVALLQTITSNIRRLVLSRVDPSDIGIEPVSGDFLSAPPALEPTVSVLEQLVSLGAKRSDPFFAISLKAAAAVEVGMEAFYPSAHQRTKLLTSRMGKGATLEVQVRWPVQERDQEDPRYERLVLMLQFECIKLGIKHAIRGSWFFFMHLLIEVPAGDDTERVLSSHFASCIQHAGFSSWQVVAGAQELAINLQRHLHWNRVEKMSHDSGAGWIRVYPRDVARFDDVLATVDDFLATRERRDPLKRSGGSP